jgi:hypothetical protein
MEDEPGSSSSSFPQRLPLCIGFAAFSGLLRVCATMVLAYPDFLLKKKQQQQALITTAGAIIDPSCSTPTTTPPNEYYPTNRSYYYYYYVAAHLLILLVAAILSIIATLYGPVSIAVPVQTGSALLWNVVAMGIVLQMRAFNKAQRTGTYVVFFSILELVDVGPGVQEGQEALQLLSKPIAVLWTLSVTGMILLATIGTIHIIMGKTTQSQMDNNNGDGWFQCNATITLAMGVTMSNVGMATSSKTFASLQGIGLVVAIIYYLFTTCVGVLCSVVSSTACDQGIFTPFSSVALILTNMVTGMIIWEDWKVLDDTWLAYLCACCLMVCGVYLLAEMDLIEQYGRKSIARVVLQMEPQSNSTVSLLLQRQEPSSSTSSAALDYILSPEQTPSSVGEAYGSVMEETDPIRHHQNNNNNDDEILEMREAFRGMVRRNNSNNTTTIESPSITAWCSTFILE